MLEELNEIIENYIDIGQPITEDMSLRGDLGMSSLDLINIAVEIEDTYNIELPDDELNKMNSIKDLIYYINLKK